MSDLVLVARDGYSFSGDDRGDPIADVAGGTNLGNHGYVSTDPDMNAIFIARGYGIRAGQHLAVIDNVDAAPTIAALLGWRMEGKVGQELRPILNWPDFGH